MTAQTVITPFPYQTECLDVLHKTKESGAATALVVMAGGLGKTITAALFAKWWFENRREARCLFLCHQNDILAQAQLEFQKVLGDRVIYGFLHGEEKSHHKADIVFGSLQTMRNCLDEFDPKEFDLVIVDETHHGRAPTYEKVILYWECEFLIGLTATPDRLDGLDIRDIYGKEVYNLPLVEALARGLLCPMRYKLMSDEILLSGILDTPQGRMSIKRLNKTVFVPRRDDEIVAIIKKHMAEIINPRVMIFCESITHCENIARGLGDAVPIHSDIPSSDERRMRLELFRQGAVPTASTVNMFNEALDVPEANLLVFLRSTESETIFYQQLCRGARPHKDKSEVVILDFVANCERISLVTGLWKKVTEQRESMFGKQRELGGRGPQPEPFNLNVDSVEFKERILPLMDLISQLKPNFYPTWQEASEAAIELKIASARDYKTKYSQDPRLPSNPNKIYPDFPGYEIYLASSKQFYARWFEATKAIVALGIKDQKEYWARRREDKRLHSSPHNFYEDFPGYLVYLGLRYRLCSEASKAAIKLGIESRREYEKRYKEDTKLYIDPQRKYPDFPGWPRFLGKE